MPASRKEKDSTNHLEHRSINHPAGLKYLKDLALGIGAGPARADGTVVTAGASPGRNGAASFRSSCHGACAVTHGHQPRADYLVVSPHIGPKISAMITRVSSVIRPEGLGDLRSPCRIRVACWQRARHPSRGAEPPDLRLSRSCRHMPAGCTAATAPRINTARPGVVRFGGRLTEDGQLGAAICGAILLPGLLAERLDSPSEGPLGQR